MENMACRRIDQEYDSERWGSANACETFKNDFPDNFRWKYFRSIISHSELRLGSSDKLCFPSASPVYK